MGWQCPRCNHYNICSNEIINDAINNKEWQVLDECASCEYFYYLKVDLDDEE